MDERYEYLCEIGQVLMENGKKDLLVVFTDMLLEHYPADLVGESFQSSDSDEEFEAEVVVKEKFIKKTKKTEIVVDGESESDSDEDYSEEEGVLTKEELTVTVDGKGFHALA